MNNNQITEYDRIMIDTINSYVAPLNTYDFTEEELKCDLESILLIIKEWLQDIEGRYQND